MKRMASIVVIFFLGSWFSVSVCAETQDHGYGLNLKPQQCAVLEEGDKCYINVRFMWVATEVGDYCITEENSGDIVQCWESAQSGQASKKYALTQSKVFYLIARKTGIRLAKKRLEVSWVYKKRSRSLLNWRVF